jgi:hypothetical protein
MIGAIVRPSESKAIRISWKSIKESSAVHELVNLHPSATQNPGEALKHILKPIKIAFAANQFMQVCEAKGDYSFIFTTAQRSKRFGQRWKPVPEHFHPITSLHSSGSRQPGVIQNGQLHLHGMLPQKIAPLTNNGAEFLTSWIRTLHLIFHYLGMWSSGSVSEEIEICGWGVMSFFLLVSLLETFLLLMPCRRSAQIILGEEAQAATA